MKPELLYAWIADIARLIPEATFHLVADATTRINVHVGDKSHVFVVDRLGREVSTPLAVANYFSIKVRR